MLQYFTKLIASASSLRKADSQPEITCYPVIFTWFFQQKGLRAAAQGPGLESCGVAEERGRELFLAERSAAFLAPGTRFVERPFFHRQGWGVVSG